MYCIQRFLVWTVPSDGAVNSTIDESVPVVKVQNDFTVRVVHSYMAQSVAVT